MKRKTTQIKKKTIKDWMKDDRQIETKKKMTKERIRTEGRREEGKYKDRRTDRKKKAFANDH